MGLALWMLRAANEEMADVLFYLLALANAWDVELEEAFIQKVKYRYEE